MSLYHIDDELDHGICELLTIYNYMSEDMGKWKLESTGACVWRADIEEVVPLLKIGCC